MAVGGIFRRPALRSVALCAMVMASALTQAWPSLGHDADEPSVIVDYSAIDEAVALRRVSSRATWEQKRFAGPDAADVLRRAAAPVPNAEALPPAVVSPQTEAPLAPQPGSADFYAVFPPPPPVPADAPVGEAAPRDAGEEGASAVDVLPISAVAALPVARPALPMRARFATPARRPSLRPAPAAAVPFAALPVRRATRYGLEPARMQLAPARPAQRQGGNELGRNVRLRLPYPVLGIDLSASAHADLEALAAEVRPNDRLRLRLAAYANAGAGSLGKARRTSLARALSVRSFLIDRGIKASRIDLRALGNMAGAAETDRVDVVISDK